MNKRRVLKTCRGTKAINVNTFLAITNERLSYSPNQSLHPCCIIISQASSAIQPETNKIPQGRLETNEIFLCGLNRKLKRFYKAHGEIDHYAHAHTDEKYCVNQTHANEPGI